MRCLNCGYEFHTDFKLGAKAQGDLDGEEPARETTTERPLSTFKIIV